MPKLDGTGPSGEGKGTGRGLGKCYPNTGLNRRQLNGNKRPVGIVNRRQGNR